MLRPAITLAWLAGLLSFFRWWDLTYLVPALPGWALVFLAAYLVAASALQKSLRLSRAELWRAVSWLAIIALTSLGSLLVPSVQIGDAVVHTVVFVKVVDTVVPVWIAARGLVSLWAGLMRLAVLAGAGGVLAAGLWLFVIAMPGRSAPRQLRAATPREDSLRTSLETTVRHLASLGERSVRRRPALDSAASWIESRFLSLSYPVRRQGFVVDGQPVHNLVVEIPGATSREQVVVVGAHYDSAEGAPGADDNASGVAALLALAQRFAGRSPERTLRFVAFTTEEPPYFNTALMGSRIHADSAAASGERIVAMLSLETVGYFSEEPGSQKYPPPLSFFYPEVGNFVAFVGNLSSRPLVRRAIRVFRSTASIPSEGAAVPAMVPGVSWSDHASFWRHGWQAIMITDTAPFRNPHYHLRSDTADRLDYGRMARLVAGLEAVIAALVAAD
jgi:hypothetical protein